MPAQTQIGFAKRSVLMLWRLFIIKNQHCKGVMTKPQHASFSHVYSVADPRLLLLRAEGEDRRQEDRAAADVPRLPLDPAEEVRRGRELDAVQVGRRDQDAGRGRLGMP